MKKCSICEQEKLLVEFNSNKKRKDGVQAYCRSCQKEYDKAYYQRSDARKADRQERAKVRCAEIRRSVDEYKRSKGCLRCGELDECCLDFHHVDGKDYHVADMLSSGVSIKKIWDEIRRCVVLCCCCHRKLHAGRWTLRGEEVGNPLVLETRDTGFNSPTPDST